MNYFIVVEADILAIVALIGGSSIVCSTDQDPIGSFTSSVASSTNSALMSSTTSQLGVRISTRICICMTVTRAMTEFYDFVNRLFFVVCG